VCSRVPHELMQAFCCTPKHKVTAPAARMSSCDPGGWASPPSPHLGKRKCVGFRGGGDGPGGSVWALLLVGRSQELRCQVDHGQVACRQLPLGQLRGKTGTDAGGSAWVRHVLSEGGVPMKFSLTQSPFFVPSVYQLRIVWHRRDRTS